MAPRTLCALLLVGLLASSSAGRRLLDAQHAKEERRQLIVGGKTADADKFKFLVQLWAQSPENPDIQAFSCGGSLLTDRLVLTAAHCLIKGTSSGANGQILLDGTGMQVRVNTHTLDNPVAFRDAPGEVYNVVRWYIHPNLAGSPDGGIVNDIAVLELAAAVEDGTLVSLASAEDLDAMQAEDGAAQLIVAGFGDTTFVDYNGDEQDDSGSDIAPVLQSVELDLLSNDQCTAALPAFFPSSQLCAGGDAGRDSCQGDSGGPALIEVDGKLRQAGIVSYGMGCGIAGKPGVYTRLPTFQGWLEQVKKAVEAGDTSAASGTDSGASSDSGSDSGSDYGSGDPSSSWAPAPGSGADSGSAGGMPDWITVVDDPNADSSDSSASGSFADLLAALLGQIAAPDSGGDTGDYGGDYGGGSYGGSDQGGDYQGGDYQGGDYQGGDYQKGDGVDMSNIGSGADFVNVLEQLLAGSATRDAPAP